ncbi:hypothetical protein BOSP111201_14570 [Bordetella sputigena]
MRRPQPRECRHQENIVRIGHAARQRFHVFRALDDAQPVAQPLHRRAGDEHPAFQHEGGRPRGTRPGEHLRVGGVFFRPRQAPAHRGQQAVARYDRLVAHVHQHEAARTVGILRHAGLEAGLPEGRGLLIARHAGDGYRAAEPLRQRLGHHRAAGRHAGQHRTRNIQAFQQLVAPVLLMDIEQQRARRIGAVGTVHLAAGQLPDQPGIDGAEGDFAAFGGGARPRHMVQQPGQLGAGEIRIQHQARAFLQEIGAAFAAHAVADIGRTPVLPDDGMRQRPAAGAVPDQRGFALVGDADGGDVGRGRAGVVQGLSRDLQLAAPDLVGVVLDPARVRVILAEFALAHAARAAFGVEYDGARTGRALVQGKNVFILHRWSAPSVRSVDCPPPDPAGGRRKMKRRTAARSPGSRPRCRSRWRFPTRAGPC